MKFKFTLANFSSITRAFMQIAGTIGAVVPVSSPYINIMGASLATIGVVWGQVNAALHPSTNPNPIDLGGSVVIVPVPVIPVGAT